MDRVLEAAGVHPGARCFFAFPLVRFLAFGRHTNLLPKGVVLYTCRWAEHGAAASWYLETKSRAFVLHTHLCNRLTSYAEEAGIDLSGHKLKSIIVAGEKGGSLTEVRNRIRAGWGNGVAVHDHYGMTEVGPVAYEMPGGQGAYELSSTHITRKWLTQRI